MTSTSHLGKPSFDGESFYCLTYQKTLSTWPRFDFPSYDGQSYRYIKCVTVELKRRVDMLTAKGAEQGVHS